MREKIIGYALQLFNVLYYILALFFLFELDFTESIIPLSVLFLVYIYIIMFKANDIIVVMIIAVTLYIVGDNARYYPELTDIIFWVFLLTTDFIYIIKYGHLLKK